MLERWQRIKVNYSYSPLPSRKMTDHGSPQVSVMWVG